MKVIIVDPIGNKIGLETFHYGYMKELALKGVNVFYFTNEDTRINIISNLELHPAFGRIWKNTRKINQVLLYLKGLYKIIIHSKKQSVDVIHLHLFEPSVQFLITILAIKFFTKSKRILSIHDVMSFRRERRNRFFYGLIVQNAEQVMVYNQYSKGLFQTIFPLQTKVTVNAMGYYTDNKTIKKSLASKETDIQEILFFGQLKKVKGIDLLIKSCGLLKKEGVQFRLTIAGKPLDISENEVQELIKSSNIEQQTRTYLRFISKKEKDELFSLSNIVVLPYTEIFNSAVLIEAASYNKAVIVSNLEPFTEIISHEENGLIFENNNIEDLTRVIIKTLSMDSEKLGNKLKDHILNNFTWEKHSKKLIEIYS